MYLYAKNNIKNRLNITSNTIVRLGINITPVMPKTKGKMNKKDIVTIWIENPVKTIHNNAVKRK